MSGRGQRRCCASVDDHVVWSTPRRRLTVEFVGATTSPVAREGHVDVRSGHPARHVAAAVRGLAPPCWPPRRRCRAVALDTARVRKVREHSASRSQFPASAHVREMLLRSQQAGVAAPTRRLPFRGRRRSAGHRRGHRRCHRNRSARQRQGLHPSLAHRLTGARRAPVSYAAPTDRQFLGGRPAAAPRRRADPRRGARELHVDLESVAHLQPEIARPSRCRGTACREAPGRDGRNGLLRRTGPSRTAAKPPGEQLLIDQSWRPPASIARIW